MPTFHSAHSATCATQGLYLAAPSVRNKPVVQLTLASVNVKKFNVSAVNISNVNVSNVNVSNVNVSNVNVLNVKALDVKALDVIVPILANSGALID
ncbi:MAG: hypothetical protein KUG79_14275 [Pseudomonadales bacterium]|nr:hypothetical protein [Pseudomonadales bacterium]